jgi:ribosome-binding factor A
MNSNYLQRTNSDILKIISIAVRQKLSDETLSDVTILRVDTAPDLSSCKVFVTDCPDALTRAGGFLRNEIAQNLKIRRVPALRFVVDNGGENAKKVEEILKKINGA